MASTLIVDQIQKTGGSTTALTLPTSNASANQYLQNDGAGALSWATVASAGFIKYTVVTATDTTFDLDSSTTKLIIEVQASGGTAGSSHSSGYNGGSGGGGAYARKLLTGITGSTDKLNIQIGAVAGIAGSGNDTSVAAAGTASFTTITCAGGSGGATASGSASGDGGSGGAVPTTGDFNIGGGNGTNGAVGLANAAGGSWMSRWNGRSNASGGVGVDALGYGGGGPAAYAGSHAGGDGGPAVVIVWEYA
tara:strand:+ start:3041 stop:3790 length:750 start_codon:yes stop_codon:yes gene_type:complete